MDLAKCQKKNSKKFGRFVEEYLFTRKQIGLIILIVDIRHDPTENDKLMYAYIKNTNKPHLIVANKADKIAKTKINDAILNIQKVLGVKEKEDIIPFSSERKIYIEDTWKNILTRSEIKIETRG